ncbi:uncharacterized protein LOC133795871 [Humulus lupulus]|uniref:uncharacterized protein LOC133795871 n=1 Tax=Humulus lupulus TaxID=3486 RepID=UPI002B413241|nr:uncharacterized protein LOC133795871 [Humulus lupulus]
MRQHRWLELCNDYDCDILYHPGKAKNVADALIQQSMLKFFSKREVPRELKSKISTLELEIMVGLLATLSAFDFIILGEDSNQTCYHDSIKISPYEAQYGRKCCSPIHWHKDGERKLIGLNEVNQATKNIQRIRQQLQTSVDRQRKYVDRRRRPLVFEIGDMVLLNIAPLKRVMRFGKKGKLSSRFIGSFEILERIGDVAYRLAFRPELSQVHDVFQVSMLRKYMNDPTHVLSYEHICVDHQLHYEEKLVVVLDHKDKVLRNKSVLLVKAQWCNHDIEDATWEKEAKIKELYPYLY